MADYLIAPAARLDLLDIWDYFAVELENPALADRCSAQAQLTFAKLARTPGLGRPWQTRRPDLADLRQWRVDGFPKLTIFYREYAGRMEIVRVIHGMRDLEAALDSRPPTAPED
jgi:toxin ParE1/3/4